MYDLQEKQGENINMAPDFASKMNELTDSVHRLGKLKTADPTPGDVNVPPPKPRGVII